MKQLLFIVGVLLLLVPHKAYARNGFWASNKLTLGYANVYVALQIDVFQLEPPRTRVETGYIFEVHDNLNVITRYQLQLPRDDRAFEHTIGLDLKLTFP